MNTISLENAIAISKKHKTIDNIDDDLSQYTEESLTPEQSCASLIVLYARSIQQHQKETKSDFGATISDFTRNGDPYHKVQREYANVVFAEVPKVVLGSFGCKPHNCHQNCINACANQFLPSETIVHTSEVSFLPKSQTGLEGILHSYIQLGTIIFDLDLGISMDKSDYDKLFNVKEISTVEARKIKSDLADSTLSQLAAKGVSTEVYLMARDDCAKMVTKGK